MTRRRARPDTIVKSWFSALLISGDEGFGSKAREDVWLMYEPWLVMMDLPAVGRGGGTRNMEINRAPQPNRLVVVFPEVMMSAVMAKKSAPNVTLRVLNVRRASSQGVCLPGFLSRAPIPAATAINRTSAVFAPPSCKDA